MEAIKGCTFIKSSLAFVAAVLERVTLHRKVHLNYSFPYDHVVIKQCSNNALHTPSVQTHHSGVHDLFLQHHLHYYGEYFTCVLV